MTLCSPILYSSRSPEVSLVPSTAWVGWVCCRAEPRGSEPPAAPRGGPSVSSRGIWNLAKEDFWCECVASMGGVGSMSTVCPGVLGEDMPCDIRRHLSWTSVVAEGSGSWDPSPSSSQSLFFSGWLLPESRAWGQASRPEGLTLAVCRLELWASPGAGWSAPG